VLFEGFPINNFDSSPLAIPDDARCLKLGDGYRYGRPSNPEHLSQKLLRQWNDVGIGVVLCEQQPSTKALLDVVQGIACRRLLDLEDNQLCTAQNDRCA